MKTLIALVLTCVLLAANADACTKPKPKPKPKCPTTVTNNKNTNCNRNTNSNVNRNRNTFNPTNTNRNRNTFNPTNTNRNNALGVGVGLGIGRGGDATANAAGGSVDLSIGDIGTASYGDGYGANVWLGEVWRPNAMVTPWCPQVIPAEAVQPIPAPLPGTTPEREISFWHDGVEYVLDN